MRTAKGSDVNRILDIYNQGIADRIATLEVEEKDVDYMTNWFSNRGEKYKVLVAEINNCVVGWVSLNPYSHRCAYQGVADLSIYMDRNHRGKGIGKVLLSGIEKEAIQSGIHKIVLFTFPFNQLGKAYILQWGIEKLAYLRTGKIDGHYVDVMAMEKILTK